MIYNIVYVRYHRSFYVKMCQLRTYINLSIFLPDSKSHLRDDIFNPLKQIFCRMIGCKSDLPLRDILN